MNFLGLGSTCSNTVRHLIDINTRLVEYGSGLLGFSSQSGFLFWVSDRVWVKYIQVGAKIGFHVSDLVI